MAWWTRPLVAAALMTIGACSSRSAATGPPSTPAAAAASRAPRQAVARNDHERNDHARNEHDPGWPRSTADALGWRVTAHPPQTERLDGDQLFARVAVAVDGPRSPRRYAVVSVRARVAIDKRRRLVALDDVSIERLRFEPSSVDEEAEAAVRRTLAALLSPLALDRLVADLSSDYEVAAASAPRLRNDPPRIFVSDRLALLVPVDGAPVWRRSSERFDRLMNTRALVLYDRSRRWLYLYVGDTWYRARSLDGEWRTAPLLLPGLEGLRAQLVDGGRVDLLDAPGSRLSRALAVGRVPRIFVSSAAAELIEIDGAPALAPIADTDLAFVANTNADLFVDRSDDRWYVLLSGRWFRARSLEGPWEFVAASRLPLSFARIPRDHAKARLLAAVTDTELAAEARVLNEVPDTATLRIAETTLEVRYDGPPKLARLTPRLRYAVNSATAVLELSAPRAGDEPYYALADGVWFSGAGPEGPWRVATAVPAVIYDIPASAPLHFVTYAHVYGATAELARVGYTPGYLGACPSGDGVVVFGTGYQHAPYVGRVWIGRPATYGLRARWEPALGWTLGGDAGSAAASFRPWWQPVASVVAAAAEPFADERAALLARWPQAAAPRAPAGLDVVVARDEDELYAGADERVYRARGAAWERYAAEGWQAATLLSLHASAGPAMGRDELRTLERARHARRRGQTRWELHRMAAGPASR